jgi:hypothetical protein
MTLLLHSVLGVSPPLRAAPLPQSATPTPTAAEPQFAPLDETLARLDRVKRVVARLQRELDQSTIDVAALAFMLNGDPDAAVDWVRREIAFEQYPGELRGAQGTLLARAGNALDTAQLLAALLTDSGYQVRIVRGFLDQEDARALVNQMMQPRPATTTPTNDEALRKLLLDLGLAFGLNRTDAEAALAETTAGATAADPRINDAQSDADLILDALTNAAVELGDPTAIDNLVSEASDYFWVEYRLSAAQPWQSAHPAFKDAALAPTDLPVSERFRDGIPAALQHRIRIQVEIEQKVEEQLQTQIVMPAWERPVADLVGHPLVYHNNLVGLGDPSNLVDLRAVFGAAPIFVPTFNNEMLLDGQAFDLNGTVYDPSLAGNDVFQLTQSVNTALEEASGLLDTLGDEESDVETLAGDRVTLSGQWIDYTLIAPDGSERTFRRTILDRIGAANRAAGVVEIAAEQDFPLAAAPLLTHYTILAMPAEYNSSYVAARYLNQLKGQLDLLDYLRKQLPLGDEPIAPPIKLISAAAPFDDVLLNTLFAAYPPRTATAISYRAAPYLVVLEDAMQLSEESATGTLRVDVINNTRRSFAVAEGELRADPVANMQAGAWETHAEGSPYAAALGRRFSTLIAFADAAARDVAVQVIRPDEPTAVAQLDVSPESAQAIGRDLAAGYVVIVPARGAAEENHAGWWRVNPRTGETLGLAEDGRGDTAVEYSFLVELRLNLILGAPSSVAGFAICKGGGGSTGCCMADAAVSWGGGAALGAAVAYKSAVAAILLGEALKQGGIIGGATGKAPSFCNL